MKSIRQLHLPYCVILLESKRVALLNRDYRLLGEAKDGWMSDEDYAAYLEKGSVKYKGLTRSALDKICWQPMRKDAEDRHGYIGWLYNDGTIPTRSKANWAAYTARLERLAKFGERTALK